MTNRISDNQFIPITLINLRFKGVLYAKKLKYDQRIEYLQKMQILLFVIPIFLIMPIDFHYITVVFELNDLIEILIFTAIFCVAGVLFNKNRLAVLIGIALFLILIIIILFSINILPLKQIATLLLISIGIGVYFNAKSLEKELIGAYKAGNEDAYLKNTINYQNKYS